jgi:DNA-3-methyladenine glycosylase II
MFCLQSKDIFPIADLAIVKAAKELIHLTTKEEIALLSENWKPRRSLAAFYLWHYYLSRKMVKPAAMR